MFEFEQLNFTHFSIKIIKIYFRFFSFVLKLGENIEIFFFVIDRCM